MTTIPVATEAQRERLLAEATSITRRRPDINADIDRAVAETSKVSAPPPHILAYRADVSSDTHDSDRFPVTVRFTDRVANLAWLSMDAVTAHRLFLELDEAVGCCEGCRLPHVRSDLATCAGNGADFCSDCHSPVCSSRGECYGDGS